MKHLLEADPAVITRLSERLKRTRDLHEYQRIQCVLMRLTLGCSAAEIALVLGWAPTTVHTIHSRWARDGDAVFDLRPKGGRRNQNMSAEEEAALAQPFLHQGQATGTLPVAELQRAYEARVGRPVALSTIYRMLHRLGWRKPQGRPQETAPRR
jgi:transposase